jgi:hypothetical protein
MDSLLSRLPDGSYALKPDLIEHHDYKTVPPEAWNCLEAWYGVEGNHSRVLRSIKRDLRTRRHYVDLYESCSSPRDKNPSAVYFGGLNESGLSSVGASVILDNKLFNI